MEFNLGKKYERKSVKTFRSILASILVTFFIMCVIIVSFMLCVMIALLLKKLWFISLIIAIVCLFTVSNIISRSLERHRISNLRVFKVALGIQYVLVIVPSTVLLIFTIFANYREHFLPTDYDLNIKSNILKVLSETKNGFSIGSITIPSVLVMLVLIFFALLIVVQIITLNYDNVIYIEGEDAVVYPDYTFSLIDDNLENNSIGFEYLRGLEFAEDDYIIGNMRYYDFYIYGEVEKYFHIETYVTTQEKNKIKRKDIIKSKVYEYDVSLFEEKNELNEISY